MRDELAAVCFQLPHRSVDTASQLLSGEFGEPSFNLIDPGRRCWREMHMVVQAPRQPAFDHSGFMGGIIVHDDVDIETVLLCGSSNVRERPWASKRQPIDYKPCCTDRLNAQR
jgi:hypothetical protein